MLRMPLFLAGTSVQTLIDYPDHSHEYYEVILTLEGEGIATIGGREYPFLPGTIHIIPPNTVHRKQAEHGFRDVFFHTDSLQFGSYTAIQEGSAGVPVVLSDDEEQTMRKLLSILLSRFRRQEKYDAILESVYHAVLQQLNEWYEKRESHSVVDDVIAQITKSFNDPEFTVTEALCATGFHKDYIRRRFQAETGTTPGHYLTDLRINYAKHLLRHQKQLRISVTEIAAMSGYYDVCYFSRIFKKKEGMSPTAYADSRPPEQKKPGAEERKIFCKMGRDAV